MPMHRDRGVELFSAVERTHQLLPTSGRKVAGERGGLQRGVRPKTRRLRKELGRVGATSAARRGVHRGAETAPVKPAPVATLVPARVATPLAHKCALPGTKASRAPCYRVAYIQSVSSQFSAERTPYRIFCNLKSRARSDPRYQSTASIPGGLARRAFSLGPLSITAFNI